MIAPDEIRKLLRAEPFQSFTLYSSDRKQYKIVHPEQAWVTHGSIFITVPTSEANHKLPLPDFMKAMFEPPSYVTQVSIGNITRMEIHEDRCAQKQNTDLKALEELHEKRPFIPFRLKTADGSAYEVERPDQLWLSELLIGVKKGGKGVFISPQHIVSTEIAKGETTLQKKTQELQHLIDRVPFRPFSVYLANGSRYDFKALKELGAPKKLGYTLFYFGEEDSVLIDVENIVEIIDDAKE